MYDINYYEYRYSTYNYVFYEKVSYLQTYHWQYKALTKIFGKFNEPFLLNLKTNDCVDQSV